MHSQTFLTLSESNNNKAAIGNYKLYIYTIYLERLAARKQIEKILYWTLFSFYFILRTLAPLTTISRPAIEELTFVSAVLGCICLTNII
jgi:hypothetical protein